MKKTMFCLCAALGLAAGVFGAPAARADVGPNDDGDYGYQPRYRRHEYREERDRCDDRADFYARYRPARVYVIERDCPVRRVVYFERDGRCFYPVGPRRVYVENYYHEYPRFYRPRPHVGVTFSFRG